MSGPEFFQTVMGQRFFESTMPRLLEQLERLNRNLEALAAAQQPKPARRRTKEASISQVPTEAECEAMPYTPAPPTEEQADAMVEAIRTGRCGTLRRKLVTHGTLGGKATGREWVIEPCGTPLFGMKECAACARRWSHPHNHPADQVAPKAEINAR